MSNYREIDVPHGDEVTTEPQRLALEAMSHDLVVKLNAMVAEQERRAQEFAAQQHSLSSIPNLNIPQFPSAPQQHQPNLPEVPQQNNSTAYQQEQGYPQTITNGPNLPRKKYTQARPSQQWDDPWKETKTPKMPTVIRDPENENKQSSIGAGTIATIIFVIFALVMHGCD